MARETLRENLAWVREDIARVQAQAGLSGEVRIVAVTKGHSTEVVREALSEGLADLGENRVQEGLEKIEALAGAAARWHLIGHLQTNKAKHVPGRFAWVHSVDSVRIARALQQAMERRAEGQRLPVLVQVNVAGEEQKSGCDASVAAEVAQQVVESPSLELRGLMTMAPFVDDERVQRRVFGDLRRLRERLEAAGFPLPDLSMGMSGDYRAAVAEGATIVRLGTVLFGGRSI